VIPKDQNRDPKIFEVQYLHGDGKLMVCYIDRQHKNFVIVIKQQI